MRERIRNFIGRLKCRVGLHTGYVMSDMGLRWFHCTRCGEDLGHTPHNRDRVWDLEDR